jgi:multimeric flavodoxin WrbA
MNILGVSTTTHTPNKEHPTPATSTTVLDYILKICEQIPDFNVKYIDANKLHIVENLSCYSSGKENCANPEAGPYRCWAHYLSHQNPKEYGGKDQMSILYDAFEWADVVFFSTSVRWTSHSALLQKIIERMNTLENRSSVYNEPNPLQGKKCGIIVVGQHYQAQEIASRLVETFCQLGFTTHTFSVFTWQRSMDRGLEQVGSNTPPVLRYLKTAEASDQIERIFKFLNIY